MRSHFSSRITFTSAGVIVALCAYVVVAGNRQAVLATQLTQCCASAFDCPQDQGKVMLCCIACPLEPGCSPDVSMDNYCITPELGDNCNDRCDLPNGGR
jgi:hypothetical protein